MSPDLPYPACDARLEALLRGFLLILLGLLEGGAVGKASVCGFTSQTMATAGDALASIRVL